MSNIRDVLSAQEEDLLFLDEKEYDEAIIGLVQGFDSNGITLCVLYDRAKVIAILAKDFGDTEEAEDMAEEFFSFNIECAYVGPHTPRFFIPIELVSLEMIPPPDMLRS